MGYENEGEDAIRRTADRLFVEFAYRKKKRDGERGEEGRTKEKESRGRID